MSYNDLTSLQKDAIVYGSSLYILNALPSREVEKFKEVLKDGSYDQFLAFIQNLDPDLENNIKKYLKENKLWP